MSIVPQIPDDQVQFAQLAARQHYIQPDQVRAALDLYRRYQAAGGEVPSIARILVGKGWLDRQRGELLFRHLLNGEPLPAPGSGGSQRTPPMPGTQVTPPKPASSAQKPQAPAQPALRTASAAAPPRPAVAQAPSIAPPPRPATPAPAPKPAAKEASDSGIQEVDNLGMESAAPAAEEPKPGASSGVLAAPTREEWIRGMGAVVVKRDLVKGYQVNATIGEGSMGIVYRAHQISMDRTVALKVLPEDRVKDQRFVEEFLAEARNAGRLNHPNLVRVHEVGKSGSTYYYSMEYIQGQRLDEWMDECDDGRLDPKEAVGVFVQIAQALDYGYRNNVIHREIRPNTIMVSADGQAKLADLGLTKGEQARFLDGENACYVSPEQVSRKPVDTRTDIYSLGCSLFHCLTGEPPFAGGPPKEILQSQLKAPTPNPLRVNPALPQDLAKVVMKMMAREPSARYQTPGEVADALKKVVFAAAPAAKKPVLPRRPMRPGMRPGAGKPKMNFKRRPGRAE